MLSILLLTIVGMGLPSKEIPTVGQMPPGGVSGGWVMTDAVYDV